MHKWARNKEKKWLVSSRRMCGHIKRPQQAKDIKELGIPNAWSMVNVDPMSCGYYAYDTQTPGFLPIYIRRKVMSFARCQVFFFSWVVRNGKWWILHHWKQEKLKTLKQLFPAKRIYTHTHYTQVHTPRKICIRS